MDDKKEKSEASLTEITIQTAPAFKLENGDIVDERTLMLEIYNKLLKIERAVA